MANTQLINDVGIMPEDVPYQNGWPPEIAEIGMDTHEDVRNTLDDTSTKNSSVSHKKKLDQTMADFLKNLESSESKTSIEKARKIRIALMFIGRHVNVDLGKIRIKKLPGFAIGEAKEEHIEIDPVLFNNKEYTADDLALIRHALLHELTHLEKKVDNEGLSEIFSAEFSRDKIRDYEGDINNVMQVVSLLSSNKESAILKAVELYGAGKYDEMYEEFKTAYTTKYPEKIKSNPDVALNVFQLAFPELQVDGDGIIDEDKEAVDDAFEETPFENAA